MADSIAVTVGTGTTRNIGLDSAVTMPDATTADVQFVEVYRQMVQSAWQTPTITSGSAYVAGDAVGGLVTFANAAKRTGGSGMIRNFLLIDEDAQFATGGLNLYLFGAAPTAPTDHALWTPSLADMEKLVATIVIGGASSGDKFWSATMEEYNELGVPYVCTATSLYLICTTSSTPTWTATNHLHFAAVFDRD